MREPTEREWLEGIGERFEREHDDYRPHPVFVERVDVDAAWEVYYQLADRRHKDGLTIDQLRQVIEAALVGVVEAETLVDAAFVRSNGVFVVSRQRFVSPWVEVEEHQ